MQDFGILVRWMCIFRKLLWKMLTPTLNSWRSKMKFAQIHAARCHRGEKHSSSALLPVLRLTTRPSSLSLLTPLSFPPCLPEHCLSIFGLPALSPFAFVLSGSTTDTAASTSTSPCASWAICAYSRGTINKLLKVSSKSVAASQNENWGKKSLIFFFFFSYEGGFTQSQSYHRLPDCDRNITRLEKEFRLQVNLI